MAELSEGPNPCVPCAYGDYHKGECPAPKVPLPPRKRAIREAGGHSLADELLAFLDSMGGQ